jgi:hypothetical protein
MVVNFKWQNFTIHWFLIYLEKIELDINTNLNI